MSDLAPRFCDTPAVLVLTLDGEELDLMDAANGLTVAEVDLGYPAVREVTSDRPGRDGSYDLTRFFGPRVVSIKGAFIPSNRFGSRQQVATAFGRYLTLRARPRLVYAIDADAPLRYLDLRASALSAPYSNRHISEFAAAWVAPDPVAYATETQTVTLVPTTLSFGRRYVTPQNGVVTNTSGWTPDRVYPKMTGGVEVHATNAGVLDAWPVVVIQGACTNPAIVNDTVDATFAVGSPDHGLDLRAGETLTIDFAEHGVYLGPDRANTRYDYVDFARSVWWPLVPGDNRLRFVPEVATPTAIAEVTWQDAFI